MKTTVTMRIDDELKAKVQEVAAAEGRTFSGVVSMLLKKWLSTRRMKSGVKAE